VSSESLLVRFDVTVGTFRADVSFDVPPGITVLFGPSGAGKSTTLAVIAGLYRPRAGRIALGTEIWLDADSGTTVAPEHRAVSLVFQSLALFPHLTALGNVEYGMARSIPRDARRRNALAMLERMQVAHVAERKPATYSGGEAQRVCLARAFARKPRVVLLDEAFSALDRGLRDELGKTVRALVRELRVPTLWVTHHVAEARAVGERAVFIRDGRVEKTGLVEDVLPASAPGD
jgi:molybdate transport system ATP-binding protein